MPKTTKPSLFCFRGLRRHGATKQWQLYAVPLALLAIVGSASAQKPPLLQPSEAAAIAEEVSGEAAHRNLEALAVYHRIRGSRQFHQAAQYVVDHLLAYGLTDAHIEEFPADGKTHYGTMQSRPAWDADFAELWQLSQQGGTWGPAVRLASWDTQPVSLADDSESADVTTDLVDVGTGTHESDYAGKDVSGKIVLVSGTPAAVARLAITRFGAVGIVSYHMAAGPNDAGRGPWTDQNVDTILWGSLSATAASVKTFAFMISKRTAETLQAQLARGEGVRVHAVVRAGERPGNYDVVTATIPGADPQLREQEFFYSCHLDHLRPGANDNLSGCVTTLEVARTLQKLVNEGRIPRPARTIRFYFGAEDEGSMAFLVSHPDLAKNMIGAVHLDMVGANPAVTGSVFHITRTPQSLPAIASDVAEALGDFVNRQSEVYAGSGHETTYSLVSEEGGKGALQAEFDEYSSGSDQSVYDDRTFRIPAIYMDDFPDRYIHTSFDTAANIDATKLKRVAFISAAGGYFLANFSTRDIPAVLAVIEQRRASRLQELVERQADASPEDRVNMARFAVAYEKEMVESITKFAPLDTKDRAVADKSLAAFAAYVGSPPAESPATGDTARVYQRNLDLKGTAGHYFSTKVDPKVRSSLKIFNVPALDVMHGGGGDYTYEILNFADGQRTVQEIRDDVSAEFGPVPTADVLAYLEACESAGIVQRVH